MMLAQKHCWVPQPNDNTLSDSSTRRSRSAMVEREQTALPDFDRFFKQLPQARI